MNQSETNPLATALAALMTGHNANPNTSLRIPLVDSNGNLQPGPTLAELAAVLGAIKSNVSPSSGGGIINIQLGKSRSWIMVVWVNSALPALPAIIGAGRNGEVTLMAGNGNITLSDTANSFCVYKPQNNGDYITVKNNTAYNLTLSYYLILLE